MPGRRAPETRSTWTIIGRSAAIAALRATIARVAPTEATVLILGERGTGKELVAREIQQQSRRRDAPFVTVNCAAIPTDLVASELFGHERGAFTGATERAVGLLRAADHGTVFLDEIGDLPLPAQAMLLRFLEEGEVRPLGSPRAMEVDVRIVAATNKDLTRAAACGDFRADLLDRLREFVIDVRPLRERPDDIPLLADAFLARHRHRHGRPMPRLTRAALRALVEYDWPGNIRELEHAISRALILSDGAAIQAADLGLSRDGTSQELAVADDDVALLKGSRLTLRQRAALHVADERGVVRRGDLITRFGISSETARSDLGGLVRAGLLRRSGAGRGTVYEPAMRRPGDVDS
jgi:DNA-binding NtrC family response regulator